MLFMENKDIEYQNPKSSTQVVDGDVFKQVYDSPASLPGKEKWTTNDKDVREIERLLGMNSNTIGAPLWVSGDTKNCHNCGRETNWLDIVSSGLSKVHTKEMIARVILGDNKFVNTEAPKAIADLHCHQCNTQITDLRSFKCHNWAYASTEMLKVLEEMHSNS
jgi:hypothetical protein